MRAVMCIMVHVVTLGLIAAGADTESKFCVIGAGAGGIQVLGICKLANCTPSSKTLPTLRCVIHQLRSVTFYQNLLAKNTRLVYPADLLDSNIQAKTPYICIYK